MSKEQKKVFAVLFVCFLSYFYAEIVLRQSAVSLVDKDKLKLDSLIGKLPSNVREGVRKEIEMASLRDAVLGAKSDSERVQALTSMALASPDEKKMEIFAEIVESYPNIPDSMMAYVSLLYSEPASKNVSPAEFYKFVEACPEKVKYDAWASAFSAIRGKDSLDKGTRLDFLRPLLERKPAFRDYQYLYEPIFELALELGDDATKQAAEKKIEECSELPFRDERKPGK